MTKERTAEFIQWLDYQEVKNHLSDHMVTQKAGISHSVISKARNGKLPKWEACNALAMALNVDPVEVFIASGLLPDQPIFDEEFERIAKMYRSLSPERRRLRVRLALILIDPTSSKTEE
jgi:hypothetical protein